MLTSKKRWQRRRFLLVCRAWRARSAERRSLLTNENFTDWRQTNQLGPDYSVGRADKTIHMLTYLDDENKRRKTLQQLNR